jgi:hypothetical protein
LALTLAIQTYGANEKDQPGTSDEPLAKNGTAEAEAGDESEEGGEANCGGVCVT